MSQPPPEQIDQFRIIREIGRGGMGVVYEAEEHPIGRRVALKLLPPAFAVDIALRCRFEREIRTTANLNHPNVIRVYAVGGAGSQPYYTMEYVDGFSLADVVKHPWWATLLPETPSGSRGSSTGAADGKTIITGKEPTSLGKQDGAEPEETQSDSGSPPRERAYFRSIARIVRDAAQGIDGAHRNGVIHRDVKPANILLTRDGQVRVTDFGLALEVEGTKLTQTGAMVGTPRYMSPEQLLRRHVRIDARTDVYSLGITLYELLTLCPAFEGETRDQLLFKIAVQEPRKPRRVNVHLPRDLETVVLKSIEKNPEHRYQSAQLVADDLTRYLNDEPILAVAPSLPRRAWKSVKRHKAVSAAVAAGLIFICVGAVSAWRLQETRRRAEAQNLAQQGTRAEKQGRLDDALKLLSAALTLDRENVLVAAKVARIETDVDALRQARERKRRERAAEQKLKEADAPVRAYKSAVQAILDLRPKIEQTWRDLHGICPGDPNPDRSKLSQDFADLEQGLAQAQKGASMQFSEAVRLLHEALSLVPGRTATRQALARLYLEALLAAEAQRNRREAEIYQTLASQHDDGSLADVLRGHGTLTVATIPDKAEVQLLRYVEEGKHLVPQHKEDLGKTPVGPKSLPMGSWLLVLQKVGYRPVRCPVLITRRGEDSLRIPLFRDEEIGDGMVYVPPGSFVQGSDPRASCPMPTETRFLPGFFIGETEVTCGQYLEFLNTLLAKNREQASKRAPKLWPWGGKRGWPLRGGRFVIPPPLTANHPVAGICWEDAGAYCEWLSDTKKRPFRLPTSAEWEKAARGPSGRLFPWGNGLTPEYANMRYWARMKIEDGLGPAPVRTYPFDRSPYGAYDMAGNVGELCSDRLYHVGDRTAKGGRWYRAYDSCRLATRWRQDSRSSNRAIGFRVACDTPQW